jgi:hypothetical protein
MSNKKIFKGITGKVIHNRFVKWIMIPCLLIFLWFTLSVIYSSFNSFTVLEYAHKSKSDKDFQEVALIKGKTVKGTFVANEDNLGILSVRFGKVIKTEFENQNIIEFRIKNLKDDEWLFINRYRSGLFKSNEYFPIGFPQIKESKGKAYEFVITSINGNNNNLVELKKDNIVYYTKYSFSKNEIFQSYGSAIHFFSQKSVSFLTDYQKLMSSLIFLLPAIFYMRWIIISSKKIKRQKNNSKLFPILVLALIIFDILMNSIMISGFMLGFLGLWIFIIHSNKLKESASFIAALILISVASQYLQMDVSVDKASTYAYLFMIVGLLQIIKELKWPSAEKLKSISSSSK